MNKFSYLLGASILLLASCSSNSDETSSIVSKSEIRFLPYVNTPTRAETIDIANLKTTGFKLFAYSHTGDYAGSGTQFMYNQDVTFDSESSSWDYAPHKSWPSSPNNVSFFAFRQPYGAVVIEDIYSTSGQGPKLSVSVANDFADQKDVLAAAVPNKNYDNSAGGAVHFDFKHILSRVAFKIVPTFSLTNTVKLTIKHLSVVYGNNLSNKGEYDFINESWSVAAMDNFTPNTVVDIITSDLLLGAEADGGYAVDSHFMFIPQNYALGGIKVHLTYQVSTYDGVNDESPINTLDEVDKTIDLPVISGGWISGKAYTYDLKVSASELIGFDNPTVGEWTDAGVAVN